jgi:hypothetical protein
LAEQPLPLRLLRSKWTWILLAATALFALCLYDQYQMVMGDADAVDNVAPGLNFSAVKISAGLAFWTLLFWVVVFLLIDRFHPARPNLWYLSLGWGISVATFVSIYINTWASVKLGVEQTGGDPAAAARTATFIAPFVEEAAKATVLFWLAILLRYRMVSKLTMISLAGLSAAGFAFTENIIYYCRVIVYSSGTIAVGDPESALTQIVWARGVFTAFGHPLFTCMTGLGIAIAVRTRSKLVRVLAPVTGYLFASLLHMLFNSQTSINSEDTLYMLYFLVVLPVLLSLVIALIRQEFTQGKLINARLTDYVRMGWLADSDPVAFAKIRYRFRALLIALLRGWRVFVATVRMQRTMTELAYIRDAEARGVMDEEAKARAKELILRIQGLRALAITDPRGLKLGLPPVWKKLKALVTRRRQPEYSQLPAGWGAPSASATDVGYSAVNPTWDPPA